MPFVLYDTYSKKERTFEPLVPGEVSLYTCGPTVYGRPHIGNYSSFLMADLLRRWLEVSGYRVKHVKNITDVGHLVADRDEGEDKIEKQAREEKVDPLAIARKYTEQYLEDEKALNMLEPYARPKATETIQEMIDIIQILMDRGHAYETEDGVYFAVTTFPDYGKLSGNMLENLDSGSRIAVDEKKRHPADFALWKKTVGENARHLLKWPSPWGEGFPGWHIECSAMSKKILGEQLDIHSGGEDNIFPHHECEIAQSECSGAKPFVRFWLHKRRIDLGSEKMSKSLGNVVTLPDMTQKGYSPLDVRYYLLSVHYRTNLKFTWKGMDDARKARRTIVAWMERKGRGEQVSQAAAAPSAEKIESFSTVFQDAMNGDLNTPGALAAIFECMHYMNASSVPDAQAAASVETFIAMARQTFGCFEPEEEAAVPAAVLALIDERKAARDRKDFAASDRLRDEIAALGYDVRDTGGGQTVSKK